MLSINILRSLICHYINVVLHTLLIIIDILYQFVQDVIPAKFINGLKEDKNEEDGEDNNNALEEKTANQLLE